MSLSSREVIRVLEADGWFHVKTKGDHHHFKHPVKPGKVTVPHPDKDLKKGTIRSIERQSGIRLLS
ncbi:type II toxin-antitoxin system HicA family toxin [Aestuariispira insulae]|uniref:Putative RNA binding protein YcfA (HicA-like mRNA interferase family) n=1 Tax=Aestuariispira insulae TaxID=1461337 RepID=A0A3D9HPR0_9PROT|nr:type II toxin-antitoxin system HicA family toxin [Aestuariispira insulae]RED51449.1 putative RNA binding protein YcfA (HicA-like mRNA interferase family) [Aestuariispira insulae]